MASRPEVDGLNAGYAALVLEEYLDNPSAVPAEWRALFESSDREELVAIQPGLARLLERFESNGGNGQAAAPPAPAPAAPPTFSSSPFIKRASAPARSPESFKALIADF